MLDRRQVADCKHNLSFPMIKQQQMEEIRKGHFPGKTITTCKRRCALKPIVCNSVCRKAHINQCSVMAFDVRLGTTTLTSSW